MSLRFVIETSPVPQATTERTFTGGQLSIGRSADADWQFDDPNTFISRRHCVISEEDGQIVATDASSGGLFVDNAANPVGLGNSVPLVAGMRLHLGDFTLRVEAASGAQAATAQVSTAPTGRSFFPAEEVDDTPPPAPVERPSDLPDPFGLRRDTQSKARHTEVDRTPRPLDQSDPFGLDLRKSPAEPVHETDAQPRERTAGGYFGETSKDQPVQAQPAPDQQALEKPEIDADIFGKWNVDPSPEPIDVTSPAEPPVRAAPDAPTASASVRPTTSQASDVTAALPPLSEPVQTRPAPAELSRDDTDIRDALLRGMGLDPAQVACDDPVAEMEQLGRCMRNLVEGVMLLLRTRAQEKQKVRVAQTIIASSDVNPLKFLATPEDALGALMRPRGKGYLAPDAAVEGAFRDLADHQVRTWAALQVALRRMVDKFDPSEIEKEMEDVGMLEALVAGGRSAKLWQIYEEKYRDIAETAEKQFLGDVGVDFRDAYENRRNE